jgi:hypothetical protein
MAETRTIRYDDGRRCDEGKVTVVKPRCNKCSHEGHRQKVVWG